MRQNVIDWIKTEITFTFIKSNKKGDDIRSNIY